MMHGTDDLTKAYRQIPVREHAFNVVAIWNPYAKVVEFFIIRGLPFGSAASVLQFNRYSQFMSYFMAVFAGVCNASYYDDYDTAEPSYSVHLAQNCLWKVHTIAGFALDKDKHVRATVSENAFLGVVTDFSRISAGRIFLRISPARRTKIIAMLSKILTDNSLSPAQASSVRGKLFFCMLSAFNKLGRGSLRAFTERQYAHDSRMTPQIRDAVDFFIALIANMKPRCLDLSLHQRSTLIIWTDAMYEATKGGLGLVAYDPDDRSFFYSAYQVPRWIYPFMRVLQTYIGQLEIMAVLFAYLTIPRSKLYSRPVLHFIDNTSMAGAIKGYSSKSDSSWLLSILHLVLSTIGLAPWFAYVASAANCSDGPSRNDFDYVRNLPNLRWLEPVSLTFQQWRSSPRDWIEPIPARKQRPSGAQRGKGKRPRSP